MKTAILVCFLVILFQGNGQELPKDLEPVVVEASTNTKLNSGIQTLTRKEFTLFQPEDLGVLFQRFAGVSMKNHGGLGGLKTFSVRGLGGAHSAILVDGFSQQNTQAGQVDLSTIQTDNVESIALIQGGKSEVLLPVSSYLSGNSLLIRTFENQFSPEVLQIRSSLKIGSFGQQDAYLSVKWNQKKFFMSAFGKCRKAHGRYPFQIENGLHSYEGMRENNALNELYGGFSAGLRTSKNSLLKFSYTASVINKGLPGAVILYNPTANQFLETEAHQANVDFKFAKKRFSSRMYFSGRYDELFYTDSSYLNVAGVLKQAFYQVNVQQGVVLKHAFNSNQTFLLYGVEHHIATLKSSNQIASNPTRQHLKTFVSLEHKLQKSELRIQLGAEGLRNTADGSDVFEKAFSPSVSWNRSGAHKILGTPIFWIKRSFRMPNFNEMYFNQIGNIHLKPEIANQVNFGSAYLWNLKSLEISTQVNAYLNVIEDKIVAIPTKNVFIWSMQNVGLVRILGADLQVGSSYKGLKNIEIRANASYSLQEATDQTDRNSFTFGHQIPYIPKHTLQGDVSLVYKKVGISFSGLYTSARFALNENISNNEIPSFYCLDATVFYRLTLKSKQDFTVQASVKNFTNQAYTFVRYFVMPGRNFLFSINYSFK